MEPTVMQKKKHLLLLNRVIRAETKKDIIPTPSKLSEDDINKYFKQLFISKDGYYVPVKNKLEINIDETLFKDIIKKPKMKEPKVKPSTEDKMKEKEMMKEKQKEEEIKMVNMAVNSIYNKMIIPYLKKKKANEDVKVEEAELLKKFFQVSNNVRNKIKEKSPKLYETLLKPKYDEYIMRKEKLSMEAKQQMKDIKKEAQEEKRKLKQSKMEE